MWREKRIENTISEAKSYRKDIHSYLLTKVVVSNSAPVSDNNSISTIVTTNSAVKMKVDEQIAIIENSPESVANLLLHPFEPIIVIADDKDGISYL